MFAIPVIIISYAVGALSVALSAGAVEYGLIPTLIIREGVRDGFPDGLGPLSEDYGSGIIVMPNGDKIGAYLAMLAAVFEQFKWMQGKVFHMKEEEAREIFDLVEAVDANGHMVNLGKTLAIPPNQRNEDYDKMLEFFKGQMTVALIPLNNVLKAFPAYRTSQVVVQPGETDKISLLPNAA